MPIYRPDAPSIRARQERIMTERANKPYRGAIFAKITSSQPDQELVGVESFIGNSVTSFAYPFASTNAWIRGMPEVATTMLTIIGGDSKELTPVGYYDGLKAKNVTRYLAEAQKMRENPRENPVALLPYRNLQAGDIDLGSRFSQQYMGLRDVYQARGGLSHLLMTSTKTEIASPWFRVLGPHHVVQDALNDEIRFGTVRRRTAATGSSATMPTLVKVPGLTNVFAKEYSLVLNSATVVGTTVSTTKMVDIRLGNVVEDDGSLARSIQTQQPLRHRSRYHTLTDQTDLEIDEQGNWGIQTSRLSTTGGQVHIPSGSLVIDVGQNMTLRGNAGVEVTTLGEATLSATRGYSFTTPLRAELEGIFGITVKSAGVVALQTVLPGGVQIGGNPGVAPQHPLLVANPTYIRSLQTMLSAESALYGTIAAYGAAASAAWQALGALSVIIDPSGAVMGLCLAAGAAGAAMATAAPAAQTANAAHLVTIAPNPVGFMSIRGMAE